jgi:hypothetical protein
MPRLKNETLQVDGTETDKKARDVKKSAFQEFFTPGREEKPTMENSTMT